MWQVKIEGSVVHAEQSYADAVLWARRNHPSAIFFVEEKVEEDSPEEAEKRRQGTARYRRHTRNWPGPMTGFTPSC